MEADTQTPDAESDATGVAVPAESASAQPEAASEDHAAINAVFRAALTGTAPSSLNPGTTDQSAADDAASEQSASPDDVSADADGEATGDQQAAPKLPRRAPKQIKNAETIDSLKAEIARRDAEIEAERTRIRDEERTRILTEQQQASGVATAAQNAERYERLIRTPDEELAGDDYVWREDYKRKLNLFPEVAEHHRAVTNQTISNYEAAFKANMRSQIDASGNLPGVDLEAFRAPGTTWTDMARQISDGAWKAAKAEDAETIAALRAELADASRQALGSAPAPVRGGRSGGPSSRDGDWLRRGLQAARG